MGKAMAVQTAQAGKMGLGSVAAMGAMRSFTGKTGRARLHTSRTHEARPVEDTIFGREKSTLKLLP
jgi:5-aminolevulinate synthase